VGIAGVEWNFSGTDGCRKADPTLKTFVFTLKNPHGFPARRFMLRPKKKQMTIYCNSECGLHFWDIGVADCVNENIESSIYHFGYAYVNDTGLQGTQIFMNSVNSQMKEIEVFEITDCTV
jgi:hypothetical protein